MLRQFNGLTQQLIEKPFRNMLYGVYNIADEERYTNRLRSYGYDTDIDSLECMIFDTNGIDDNTLADFKKYIETDVEKDKTAIGIIISKSRNGKYGMVAIKPKKIEVKEVFKSF